MDVDAPHAERVGHQAGMLAAGAAEAAQRVLRDVVAALDRDLLDGVRHVLDGDPEEALGHFDRRAAVAAGRGDRVGERGELALDHRLIERRVAVGTEDAREEARLQLAEHDVAIGDGERPAAAVAGGARIGAGRFRADAIARAVEAADRAAARRHGVDMHHRRAHAHAGHHRLEAALVFARVMRDVGRGAAHVEADDLVESPHLGGAHGADDAAGGARQDRILALEAPRVGEAAVRLHEEKARAAELGRHPVDIAPEDRREIGVDHGGVAAAHQLHQRAHLMADRHLGEAQPAREIGGVALMPGKAVAMQEDDRRRADAGSVSGSKIGFEPRQIERGQHLALGGDALVGLDDALVELLRQDDMALEQLRPVLIADAQRVAEAPGDHQHGALALALQQRVGGDRRAHLHRGDGGAGDRRIGGKAEQVADALDRRVAVALGIVGEQLVGQQRAVRAARHHVGERAAAVDPELPAGLAHAPAPASGRRVILGSGGGVKLRRPGARRAG